MDVLTVLVSALIAIPIQLGIMYLVYSRWILPAIDNIVSNVPSVVRANLEPYVDEKIGELNRSVKASSASFQRTVNRARDALALDEDVDLTTEEGIQEAQNKLSTRYGMDVAIQAVSQLIQSIEGRKKPEISQKGVNEW